LGFLPIMAVPEDKSSFSPELEEGKRYLFAMVQSGGVEIMLQQEESLREDVGNFFTNIGASATYYIRVDDVDKFYETIATKVEIIKPIETTWYGMREFYIRDIDGYVLAFATQVV
jgi:uncharacterized glyoxalase superfamily protein PhnB